MLGSCNYSRAHVDEYLLGDLVAPSRGTETSFDTTPFFGIGGLCSPKGTAERAEPTNGTEHLGALRGSILELSKSPVGKGIRLS